MPLHRISLKPPRSLPEALRLLRGYRWPGNVRELEDIIERLALTVAEKGIISDPDERSDTESNGLADSTCCQNVKSSEPEKLREVIISRRLNLSMGTLASENQCEREELELYLRQVCIARILKCQTRWHQGKSDS